MIAVSSSGKSFRAIAWYLAAGRTGQEQDRVGWTASRNLPTSDPQLAAVFMRATAAQSDRIEKPVYHIALSFDPSDPVDRPTMEQVADHVLERLGLAEHQAIIVAHRDRSHPHLHLLINRVHPETGKAWERWRDRVAIQEVLRAEERALGLREVPGTLAPAVEGPEVARGTESIEPAADGRRHPRKAPEPDRPQAMEGKRDGPAQSARPPREPAETVAREIRAHERATDLQRRQYQAGLSADAAEARAAQLDRALHRAQAAREAFQTALGATYLKAEQVLDVYLAMAAERGVEPASQTMRNRPELFGELKTIEQRRALGLVRTTTDRPARFAAHAAADRGRLAAEAQEALLATAAQVRARRVEEDMTRELTTLYRDPQAARVAFDRAAAEQGIERAAAQLRNEPAVFGDLVEATARQPATAAAHARRASELAVDAAVARATRSSPEGQGRGADPAAEHTDAWATTERARARAHSLHQQLAHMPGTRELEHRIRQGLRALTPRDLDRLRVLVTAPQYALAQRLRRTVRDLALGREDQRDR